MRKIVIMLLAALLVIAAGCVTAPVGDGAEKAEDVRNEKVSEKETVKEAVTQKIQVPYLTRETGFYSDGFIESYRVYTYDEQMKPVREDLFDSFDEMIESLVYEQVSVSEMKISLYNKRGELQSWKLNKYDSAGYHVATESYNAANVKQTASKYEYDADGRKVNWIVEDGDGVALSETKYIYDGDDCVKIEIYSAAGKLVEYFENEYQNSLIMKAKHYSDGKTLSASVEYVYENNAPVAEKHLRANGSVSRTVKYTNDSNGSAVKAEYYDGNGSLKDWTEYEYEYITEEVTVLK